MILETVHGARRSAAVSQNNLHQLLGEVHERLRQPSSIDPESRELLKTVMHDIERTLSGASEPPAHEAPARLESLAVQFEAEHPQLADTLRQIIDALGKGGI
jgi:hypothetical protein